jgi:Domain of unknown function (DUF5134)
MHGPPLVAWLLVALSAAATASCLVRDEARSEALMGVGMAVMAVPLSVFDPRPWAAPVFTVVYTLVALHTLMPSGRDAGHRLHHVVSSAAMVYMAVAMAGAGPAGSSRTMRMSEGSPVFTGLLLVYFAGYVLRAGVSLALVPAHAGLIPGGAATVRVRHAPEVAVACRVSMALGMFAMLLVL